MMDVYQPFRLVQRFSIFHWQITSNQQLTVTKYRRCNTPTWSTKFLQQLSRVWVIQPTKRVACLVARSELIVFTHSFCQIKSKLLRAMNSAITSSIMNRPTTVLNKMWVWKNFTKYDTFYNNCAILWINARILKVYVALVYHLINQNARCY